MLDNKNYFPNILFIFIIDFIKGKILSHENLIIVLSIKFFFLIALSDFKFRSSDTFSVVLLFIYVFVLF